jgi:hypothetical protein
MSAQDAARAVAPLIAALIADAERVRAERETAEQEEAA